MDNKTAFIAGAILDIQSTIRAVDVKIGALLVAILMPFSNLGRICAHFQTIISFKPSLGVTMLVLFFVFWIFSIFSLIRGISAIDNPSKHIVNADKFKGSFYGGYLYQFGKLDIFLNRQIIKANKDVISFELDIPDCKKDIERELTFEQMKLIYIRDIKLHRLHWALNFSALWFAIGLATYVASKQI